jgi:hypothetical protein
MWSGRPRKASILNTEWLDIGIGVVSMWFLLALVVTAVNEGLVRVLALRAKQLWKALAQMLDGTEQPTGRLASVVNLARWPWRPSDPHPGGGAPASAKIYGTSVVQVLENRTRPRQATRIHHQPAVEQSFQTAV